MSKFISSLMCGGLGLAAAGAVSTADAAIVTVDTEATVRASQPTTDQDEAAAGYIHVKYSGDLASTRQAYFQFDLAGQSADLAAAASFSVFLQSNRSHVIQVWALDQAYAGFVNTVTWDTAQANETTTNDMLTTGALTATQIGGVIEVPGTSSGDEVEVNLASLAPFVFGDKITFAITGVDDTGLTVSNNSAGLRLSLGDSATPAQLEFSQVPEPGSLALLGLGGLLVARRRRA